VYISDYWKIVHEKQSKSRRSASDFLKRTLSKGIEVSPIGSMDYQIETHYLRDQIFILWPKLELCLVNAQETSIHSMKMFTSITDVLAESYGLEVTMDIEDNFIELKFENLTLKDSVTVEKELQSYPAFTGFSGTEIWVEFELQSAFGEQGVDFRVKDLHNIFRAVVNVVELTELDEEEEIEAKVETSVVEVPKVKSDKS
jgi:hypothetical protein